MYHSSVKKILSEQQSLDEQNKIHIAFWINERD